VLLASTSNIHVLQQLTVDQLAVLLSNQQRLQRALAVNLSDTQLYASKVQRTHAEACKDYVRTAFSWYLPHFVCNC
jgi:hypothetical protein